MFNQLNMLSFWLQFLLRWSRLYNLLFLRQTAWSCSSSWLIEMFRTHQCLGDFMMMSMLSYKS
ncbi:hypothetical protein RchiOBHm_Chr6g0245221 [Rosa chinensis]|uniref:Uncharacterized protein n=1 Tax=Rosa chinensis TaxID=74649 RepID=A0A2P6PJ80_ROSCH|nr:hypothetical protein RchiOBHm_Chr6g0245221 [Rosa chinensis]